MYLVTGGAGFIGSHIIDALLQRGESVICVDNLDPYYPRQMKLENIRGALSRRNFIFMEADIRDKGMLEEVFKTYPVRYVIHLAAKAGVRPSIEYPALYADVNIGGTINLLEVVRKSNIEKFIFASSSSVYGDDAALPFSEEERNLFPVSPYGCTKLSGEIICSLYNKLYGLNIIILRFFTVYGPRQRPEMAIHKFTRLIDEEKEVPVYGDGSSMRDYTYIDDIVEGVLACIDKITGFNIINLGNSHPVKLSDLIRYIEEALGKKARIINHPEQKGDVKITCADIRKAEKLIGFRPKVSLEEGLKRFIKWYNGIYHP
ncbi:MAG: GDP-mannose 4,6-dehydratase [Candidatus Aenigmatarchaeota archaeon]